MSNSLIVKEPEELVLMRGDFTESALKLASYLIAILEKDKTNYQINVKNYLKEFDKSLKDFSYIYKVAEELSDKKFKFVDRFKKKFAIYNFISSVTYADGILEVEFSQKLLAYLLEIKDKFLKYNIKNIMRLSSKYSIRLYKILKDEFEKKERYLHKPEVIIRIDDLREMFNIPPSYDFYDIKRRILTKAKKEFEEYTDITFDYETIKLGKKVDKIKFIIEANIDDNSSLQEFIKFVKNKYKNTDKALALVSIPSKNNKKQKDKYFAYIDDKGYLYVKNLKNKEKEYLNKQKSLIIFKELNQISKIFEDYFEMLKNKEDFKEKIKDKEFLKNFVEAIKKIKQS